MDFDAKATNYMDTNFYDMTVDPYLQYPHSPYGANTMGLPPASGAASSPKLDFNTLNLASSNLGEYAYPSSYTTTASPARPFTPPDGVGISPAGLYNLSAGEMSSDGTQSGRRSRGSGTHSPASSQGYAAVPRSHRFNPIAPPATRARAPRRKSTRQDPDSDDEDEEFQPALSLSGSPDSRRETIRKQRIESEQRRRDELREGYQRLKDTLPSSNQKASKVSLLDRATTHLKYLDTVKNQLEARLKAAESEVHRLRSVNEALMLGTAEQRHAAAAAAVAAVQQSHVSPSNF
jgi:hypothetical protein